MSKKIATVRTRFRGRSAQIYHTVHNDSRYAVRCTKGSNDDDDSVVLWLNESEIDELIIELVKAKMGRDQYDSE